MKAKNVIYLGEHEALPLVRITYSYLWWFEIMEEFYLRDGCMWYSVKTGDYNPRINDQIRSWEIRKHLAKSHD